MKKALILAAVLAVIGGGVFAMKDKIFGVTYRDGVYEGEYQADDGENTKVILTLKDNRIVACVLEARDAMGNIKDENHGKDGSAEDFRQAQRAVREMTKDPDMQIETQDVDKMDSISGASVTYKAMQIAVHEALNKAR